MTKAGELLQVPCSKADVFSSTFLTVLEKRALMRLQSFSADLTMQQAQEQLEQAALANKWSLGGVGVLVRVGRLIRVETLHAPSLTLAYRTGL